MYKHKNYDSGLQCSDANVGGLMKKRKIDLDDVAIICGLLSIIINVVFSGKELLANVRWLLSYLGL